MSEPVEQKTEFRIANPGPPLNKTQIHFMRLIEQQNRDRVEKLQIYKKRCNISGLSLIGIVGCIYAYTLYAVRQEKSLEDFDEPAKVIDVKK